MRKVNSLGNRLIALALCIIMVTGLVPAQAVAVDTAVAKIGDVTYDSLAEALAAVPTGTNQTAPSEATTVTLLRDTTHAFDVGTSTGSTTMNLVLDLNGKTLTLAPSVGSVGTKSNGIRVLAYSKLEIKNGKVICSSEEADNVKTGIANYSELVLDSVAVQSGDLTIYTINNRGNLTLKGNTSVENGKVKQTDYADSTEYVAITNDPYNLYYTTPINAEINCADAGVEIGNVQLETYGSKGNIELNITNGTFGGIYEPAAEGTVTVKGAIAGGSFATDVNDYCDEKYSVVLGEDGKYTTQYIKDDQTDFGFAGPNTVNITFNDNGNQYTNLVENKKGTVTYAIVSEKNVNGEDADVAEINAETGELTILKAGTVQVKASDTGNDLYNPAEATYTLVINRDDQSGFGFDPESPEDQWVGKTYQNKADGGQTTNDIRYEIVSGPATITQDGVVTFTGVGRVEVKATRPGDDCYKEISATYVVTAVKNPWEPFVFTVSNPAITYKEGLKYPNAEQTNALTGEDEKVTYAIVVGEDLVLETDVAKIDADTGILTILQAGTVTVRATRAEDDKYHSNSAEYTLTVNKADQTISTQEEVTLTWQEDGLDPDATFPLTGAMDGNAVEYIIPEEYQAVAKLEEGKLVLLKAGSFELKIRKVGDDCYNASNTVTVQVTVEHADQSDLSFAETTDTITFNDNGNVYTQTASQPENGDKSSKDIIYQLKDGENLVSSTDVAEITDSANGVLKIKQAGTVTVVATRPGDEQYKEITATYELTVEKDEQDYSLPATGTVSLKYGVLSYTNALVAGTNVSQENEPVYTIAQNTIGASVNAINGDVTFVDSQDKVGKVTVTVTVAEDACYKKFTASYEIDVSYLDAPADQCTLSGTKATPNSTSDWFVKDLEIQAPAGYEISFNNKLSTDDWDDAQPYSQPGETTAKVYLKRISDGAITDAIDVAVKYDDTAPNNLKIDYKSSFMQIILQKIFLLTKDKMTVEFSAEDAQSGIAKVEYSLDKGATFTALEPKNGVYSVVVEAEMKDQVALRVTNGAGTVAEMLVDEKVLVIDKTNPVISAGFTGEYTSKNGILYTKDNAFAITFRVEDVNFSDIMNQENGETKKSLPVVTVNGVVKELIWSDVNGHGEATLPLPDEGDYKIKVTANDRLNDADPYEVVVHVDKTAPVINPVAFDNGDVKNTTPDGRDYYAENQTAVIEIIEHNFNAEDVQITITANGQPVSADAYVKENWVSSNDKNTLVLEFTDDANYTLDVAYTDIPGHAAADYAEELFTVDKKAPDESAVIIEYKTLWWPTFLNNVFGFAKDSVEVTIKASDATAGIKSLSYSVDGTAFTTVEKDSHSFTISAQYEGKITVRATDYSENERERTDNKTVIVDNIPPVMSVTYSENNRKDQILKDNADSASDRQHMDVATEQTRFVYAGNITATLRIEETHFYASQVKITVTRDGTALTEKTEVTTDGYFGSAWTETEQDGKKYQVKTLTLSGDGDYVITVEYADESSNEMTWSTSEHDGTGTARYVSNIHTIDTKAPEVTVTYTDKDTDVANTNYHSANRTATITIKDRNFRPNELLLEVEAEDVTGADITVFDYNSLKLTSWMNQTEKVWELVAENTWQTVVDIPFAIDGNYSVEVTYQDIAENPAQVNPFEQVFTVDHDAPKDLSITYSKNVFEEILSAVSFGYYNAPVTVTMKATDMIAGMEYFTITAEKNGPVTATTVDLPKDLVVNLEGKFVSGTAGFLKEGDVKVSSENGTVTMEFEVPAQFRGAFAFSATDMGHLTRGETHPQIQVVDTIDPLRTVTYTPTAIVDKNTLKNVQTMTEGDDVILYYNKDAVAVIEVVEANFYPEDVAVKVNGTKVDLDSQWTTPEGRADDVWTNTLTLKGDGDYVITIEYTDRSSNEMKVYTSQTIVIDTTAPVIDVKYSNTDVKNTIGGRDYFSAAQTATITVKEHNFRADDVVIKVTAKDVLGADVLTLNADGTVKAYADQGADRKSWSAYETGTWRRTDDAYVITLNYTADANYTFDIEYQDLATNKAADYAADSFTVDQTAPANLTVSYSTNVFQEILESITFGYYNAQMTVTITAEDDTSGIYHFAYSYIKGKDVSGVNAELLDQAIREAEITYDGKKATATFTVPKMVLSSDNQFNGTVQFAAFDRSEVSTELKDSTVIIVDNISPVANITYNAPVQNANGISYYDGNINASVVINEANFDAGDVVVTVTKDGVAFPVNVAWHDDNVDTHTGTFTLTDDGDYIVSVQYTDKSGNQMAAYTSNELTLDATKPVIHVSDIKANSANKDAEYGFVISVTDTNLDASTIKPVLKAVKKNAEGVYETVEIDLGKAVTVVNGQAYTFTVENLPDDALYTLTCEVKDMSANGMAQIVLEDGKSYDQVSFSVNRNGSVFGYGNTFTEELVGQYYVYSVDEDVVIVEVNVDPIEEYKVTLNGKELVEGTDYTSVQTSKDGEWSKRTYTIKKELFEAEGEYSMIVSSTDKADTTAFSDVKNLTVAFVVDQTKPVLTITGLEAGGRYQTDAQTVTLIPTDEGGRLSELTVVVLDADGNPLTDESGTDISVRFTMSGDELLQYLAANDGKVTFTIPEGLNNQVKIICNDCAVGGDELTNEYNELFARVTVSQNQLVIFYANTPLFIGTIVGVLAVIALIIILIKRKKDKKSKAKANH